MRLRMIMGAIGVLLPALVFAAKGPTAISPYSVTLVEGDMCKISLPGSGAIELRPPISPHENYVYVDSFSVVCNSSGKIVVAISSSLAGAFKTTADILATGELNPSTLHALITSRGGETLHNPGAVDYTNHITVRDVLSSDSGEYDLNLWNTSPDSHSWQIVILAGIWSD